MIGLPIREISPLQAIGFASSVLLYRLIDHRLGRQFSREVVTVGPGVLTHEDRRFLSHKRTFWLVKDEVSELQFHESTFSFKVLAKTNYGDRTIAHDIELSRREEYQTTLEKFAPTRFARDTSPEAESIASALG